MVFKINKLPESQVEIDFDLSTDEFEKFEKRAFSQIRNDFEVDGFRKGKAPDEIILKHLGEEKILSEAANMAMQESFTEVIRESNLEIISKPEATILKIAKGNNFQFKIKVSVMPIIEIPEYKKIAKEIEKRKIEITDDEIIEALKWTQKSRAKFSLKNSPAEKGDFIEIEYSTIESGEKKYDDAFILGEGHFLIGFEESLIGMKNSEEKEVKFKTKEEKETTANVKIVAVKKVEMPQLNDDFAISLGNFKNIESLKESVKEGLKIEKENAEKQRVRTEIIEKIAEKSIVEIPQVLKDKEKDFIIEDIKKRVKESLNITFEEYLQKINKNMEEMEKSTTLEAEKKIKNILILREIGKKEKIEVEEKEVEEETQKVLSHYSDKKDIELNTEELRERVRESLIYEKTFKILENCVE